MNIVQMFLINVLQCIKGGVNVLVLLAILAFPIVVLAELLKQSK